MADPVEILRDALFGNPPSPTQKPSREGVLAAFTAIARALSVLAGGAIGTNATAVYASLATLNNHLEFADRTLGLVYNDGAKSGIYIKSGAANTGSWMATGLLGIGLPGPAGKSFLQTAIDVGYVPAGTTEAQLIDKIVGQITAAAQDAADDARVEATRASAIASQAAASASQADAAVGRAQAAADTAAAGVPTFFDTYAQLAAAGLPNGTVARVWRDETRGGGYAEYRIQAGAPVFKLPLPRAPERAIYLSQFLTLDARLENGSAKGTDITTGFQALVDAIGLAPVDFILDGPGLWSGIRLWSNTRLIALAGGIGYQTDSANVPFIRNKNPLRGQFGDTEEQQYARIIDHDIQIVGGAYFGNLAFRTAIRGVDNEFVNLVSLYGVRDAKVNPTALFNPGCYFTHLALCERADVGGFFMSLPQTASGNSAGPTGYNGDGCHLNGPCRDIMIHDMQGVSGDDFVALTASDGDERGVQGMFADTTFAGPNVGEGPIRRIRIARLDMRGALYGTRLLTKHVDRSPIVDVTIEDCTGWVYGRFLNIDNYPESGNPSKGWVDRIAARNFAVRVVRHTGGAKPTAQNPFPQREVENRSVNIGCAFGSIVLDGFTKLPTDTAAQTHYPMIDIDGHTEGDHLVFRGFNIRNRGTEDLRGEGLIRAKAGALVRTLEFDDWDWQRDTTVPANGHILDWQGGAIGVMRLRNIRANRCENLFKLRGNGSYSVIQLSDVYVENLAPYAIDETKYLDPNTPRAPSGLVYLNAGFHPIVTMSGHVGAPPLVGPTALLAKVAKTDDERVSAMFNGDGSVNRYLGKTDSIESITRLSTGVYSVNHRVPIALSDVLATSYTINQSTQPEFTSATQTKIYVTDRAGALADTTTLSVVLQRGGYVS